MQKFDPELESKQLTLPVSKHKQKDFSSFVSGENDHLVTHLKHIIHSKSSFDRASQRMCVTIGAKHSGKTHLLLACVEEALRADKSAQYIDLNQIISFPSEVLEQMTSADVLCFDNIQVLSGNSAWQIALFDAINRFVERNGLLLMCTSNIALQNIDYELKDLYTRLTWGTNFSLRPLKDEHLKQALELHMRHSGLRCNKELIEYLHVRLERNINTIATSIEKLERITLTHKRQLTIPFARKTLKL